MKQRFPSFLHLQYFYQGERVNDLQKILNELKKNGINSLKLTAKNEISKIEEVSKEESRSEFQSLKEELPSFVKECSIKSISDIKEDKLDLPSEFYTCY